VCNSDIALIQNNALVGSQIALELNKLREIKVYGKPQTVNILRCLMELNAKRFQA
jgi:hypothetical protein